MTDSIQLVNVDHRALADVLGMLWSVEQTVPECGLVRVTIEHGDITAKAVWLPTEKHPVVTITVNNRAGLGA